MGIELFLLQLFIFNSYLTGVNSGDIVNVLYILGEVPLGSH